VGAERRAKALLGRKVKTFLFNVRLPRGAARWYNTYVNLDDVEMAFYNELQKIGASNMLVPQARYGRRSISADNLLKRDRDGKLFKHTPKPALEDKTAFSMAYTTEVPAGAEVKPKRRKGEPPSREDVDTGYVVDQRTNASIIPGTGTWMGIAPG
jgi:hypothetical protein